MNILILQGSPRKNGNTSFLVNAFKKGLEKSNHNVEILNVGTMKIAPCMSCEYCHNKGNGECIQKDDMQKIYESIKSSDMMVFASPVYYFNFSGQLQNVITRFYPSGILPIKKYALILSSYSSDVYSGIIETYKNILDYFSATNLGIKCINGENQKTDENHKMMVEFGISIK